MKSKRKWGKLHLDHTNRYEAGMGVVLDGRLYTIRRVVGNTVYVEGFKGEVAYKNPYPARSECGG